MGCMAPRQDVGLCHAAVMNGSFEQLLAREGPAREVELLGRRCPVRRLAGLDRGGSCGRSQGLRSRGQPGMSKPGPRLLRVLPPSWLNRHLLEVSHRPEVGEA